MTIASFFMAATLAAAQPVSTPPSPPPATVEASVERNVSFAGGDGRARLAGTLTLPQGAGPFPAAILLSVAGPDDRDQTLGPHRGYRDLAQHLAGQGIASLRFDDRGVGGSTGDYFSLPWQGFADDAAAAFDRLQAERGIDRARIGFIGMSQGGAIGAMATGLRPQAAFLILLSAPGIEGSAALRAQLEATMRLSGVTGTTADQYRALFERFLHILRNDAAGRETQRRDLISFLSGPGRALIPPYAFLPRDAGALADLLLGPWYRSNLTFDPAPVYGGLAVPVLAIGGGRDLIAPPAEHLAGIEALLDRAPTREKRIVLLPDTNHLLQSAVTGLPNEYRSLGHAISPAALETIGTWLATQVASRR